MFGSDKQSFETRARVVLALLAGETTVADAARAQGVAESEVRLWKELYLAGARAQLGAQHARQPWSKGTRRAVAVGALLGLVGMAGVAASQNTWPISLITFTADTPAVASEVNGNFSAVKAGVEQVKTWLENKVGPVDQGDLKSTAGGLMSDYPGGNYDLWLQGSTTTPSGTNRNLALLGDTVNDKLIIDYDGEYEAGVEVQSSLNVFGGITAAYTNVSGLEIASPNSSGFQPLSVTTFPMGSSPRRLMMDDDEIMVTNGSGGVAPLYIQGNGTTSGVGGPTQLGGDVGVLGNLTVQGEITSANRYVVTARYDPDYYNGNQASAVSSVDINLLIKLCGDVDGCSLTFIMKDYIRNAQLVPTGEDASFGPFHFDYDSTTNIFRAADGLPSNSDISRTIGTNGNGVLEHAFHAWNCYFTDSQYTQGSSGPTASPNADPNLNMYLMNFNVNTGYKPDCVMVIDD